MKRGEWNVESERRERDPRCARVRPPSAFRLPPSRPGLTLIELLIVLTILILLVSSAIPVLSPSNDGRKLREASRMVNQYLSGAQARAIQSGRPFGVTLKKLSQDTEDPEDNGVCIEMFYVEQPAPYAGFTEASRCRAAIRQIGISPIYTFEFVTPGSSAQKDRTLLRRGQLPWGWSADLFPPATVRPGDILVVGGTRWRLIVPNDGYDTRLDGDNYYESALNSPAYRADRALPTTRISAVPIDGGAPDFNFAYDHYGERLDPTNIPIDDGESTFRVWTEPMRYKILRQPVATFGTPMQLPDGTAIDLRASGRALEFNNTGRPTDNTFHFADQQADGDFVASDDRINTNRTPLTIMFAPDGSMSAVYGSTANDDDAAPTASGGPPVTPMYLLVGLRENIPHPPGETVAERFDAATNAEFETEKAKFNWLNGGSRWVSIAPGTGSILSTENAFVNPVTVEAEVASVEQRIDREIYLAREFARQHIAGE